MIMRLLNNQKNDLFNTLEGNDLPPSLFSYQEPSPVNASTVIRYKGTQFYFEISETGEGSEFIIQLSIQV